MIFLFQLPTVSTHRHIHTHIINRKTCGTFIRQWSASFIPTNWSKCIIFNTINWYKDKVKFVIHFHQYSIHFFFFSLNYFSLVNFYHNNHHHLNFNYYYYYYANEMIMVNHFNLTQIPFHLWNSFCIFTYVTHC